MITEPSLNANTKQLELNYIGARADILPTIFKDPKIQTCTAKSAIATDSLFLARLHNLAQKCSLPTVQGQFDDADDADNEKGKTEDVNKAVTMATATGAATAEDADAALTLLNARNISKAGQVKNPIPVPCHTNRTSQNINPRSMSSPVSMHHQTQYSQYQYRDDYHLHSRNLPSRRIVNSGNPNERMSNNDQRVGAEMRKTMARMVEAGIGRRMPRFPLPSSLQAASQPHFSSLPQQNILDGASKAYPNIELNRKMADNWKMVGPPSSKPIYDPNDADVLFGRGGAVNTHPGNIFFRSQVTHYHPRYVNARNHAEKSTVVRFIHAAIRAQGGRFLKYKAPSKVWYIVDERDATVKTMQSLRDVKTSDGADGNFFGMTSSPMDETIGIDNSANDGEGKNLSLPKTGQWGSKWFKTMEMSRYHEDCDRDSHRDGSNMSQGLNVIGNTAPRPTTNVNGMVNPPSLPSKKRLIECAQMKTEGQLTTSSNQPSEHAKKRIKQNPTPPSMALTPATAPKASAMRATSNKTTPVLSKSNLHEGTMYLSNLSSNASHNNCITKTSLHQQQPQFKESKVDTEDDLQNILVLRPEDVLSGRGGGTNRHPGNIYFRQVVHQAQPEYVKSRKKNKSSIARDIVKSIRNKNGRFLKFHPQLGVWHDVGDKKATEKTSQALREGLAGSTVGVSSSSSGSGDDGAEFIKKGAIPLQYQNKTRDGGIPSANSTFSPGPSQNNPGVTTLSSANDNGIKKPPVPQIGQWGSKWLKPMGRGHSLSSSLSSGPYLSRIMSSP